MSKNYVFSGKWIDAGISIDERLSPLFKKGFVLGKDINRVVVKICGLGLFEMKINGSLPDDTLLNPGHSQYSQTVLFRSFDVTNLVAEGKNEITVMLGNSFFNETTPVWNWHNASWRSAPKLIADITAEYSDGTVQTVSTDESWLVTLDGPITANSIYMGETYDARRTDFTWKNAFLTEAPSGNLKEQVEPHIRRIAAFDAEKIVRISEKSYVVYAPEMTTGWAKLKLKAEKDTKVYITYGESLTAEGAVQKIGRFEGHDGGWWPDGYIQQDCFISNGEPFDYEPKFSYKGFKYFQVDGVDSLEADDIKIFRIANDVETISEFFCSDEMLNKMHRIMCNTLLNNFQGKPTDTPVWEKNGWLGDANCALPIMMFNFDMSSYLRNFIDIMADCLHEFGSIPVIVPSANWSTDNSPVWNSIFVFGVQALMDYCNMYDYAEKIYPDLKEYALFNINQLREIGWVWGTRALCDWISPIGDENAKVDPNPSEGAEICCTSFIFAMLKAMVYIAENLGFAEDIPVYENATNEIYGAFNAKFYNKEHGIYETTVWNQKGSRTKYRQTSNLLPLAFGLVPEENVKAVTDNLVKDFIAKDYHLDTGCAGTRFVLPVLLDSGYTEIAYKILRQTTYPSWGYWLKNGADSAWESWEITTRSRNHYFLATYDEIFFTHIAGIKNIRKGYRSFTLSPALDIGLEFAKTSVRTPLGILRCDWKKTCSGTEVEIEIPHGATAEIYLKDKSMGSFSGGKYKFTV